MKNSKNTSAKKVNSSKVEILSSNVETSKALVLIPKNIEEAQEVKEEKTLSQKTLDALLALNISETTVKNADRKTIFKKEFNNKKDRTKARTKIMNAIELYLLNIMHNKLEKALESLEIAKSVATFYYVAESKFDNYLDYCSENMDEAKKNTIKTFITVFQEMRSETVVVDKK